MRVARIRFYFRTASVAPSHVELLGGPPGEGGGGVLAPSFGTYCETDTESSGGDSRDRRAVNAPYPKILEWWDISKGACFNIMALKTGYEGINIIANRM